MSRRRECPQRLRRNSRSKTTMSTRRLQVPITFLLILVHLTGTRIHICADCLSPPFAFFSSPAQGRRGGHTDTTLDHGDHDENCTDVPTEESAAATTATDRSKKQSVLKSPFRIMDEVRTGSTAVEIPDEESLIGNSNSSNVTAIEANHTEEEPKKKKKSKRKKKRVLPKQTTRSATLSKRLIQSDSQDAELSLGNRSSSIHDESETSNRTRTEERTTNNNETPNTNKLWWVNSMWTEQLADIEDSREETSMTNVSLNENKSSHTALDIIPTAANTTKSSNDESIVSIVGNNSLTDIGNDTTVPLHAINTNAAGRPSNTSIAASENVSYISTGLWKPLDNLITLGLASQYPALRLSRRMRSIRKVSARVTGLHGLLSGKPDMQRLSIGRYNTTNNLGVSQADTTEDINVTAQDDISPRRRRRGFFGVRESKLSMNKTSNSSIEEDSTEAMALKMATIRKVEELRRMARVQEIDRLIAEGQDRMQDLICEKDVLQRRPNPLYSYSSDEENVAAEETELANETLRVSATRDFNFPPDDLVDEYLEMIFSSHRMEKMNHTQLWKDDEEIDDDDEYDSIGDDVLTPSADAHKLYRDRKVEPRNGSTTRARKKGGGSWLLRQSLGKGPSLGEKIGESAETAAYKAICSAVMSFLARALASLHGINVMTHSDIRLVLEQAPDLPPIRDGIIPGGSLDYAKETIKTVINRKAKRTRNHPRSNLADDSFVQCDAVTEMLLSHVQISAPLLKLFPLAWQRAFLGNIIVLSTAVLSDFCDGLQFQILGHQLSFKFKPITEEDMINSFGLAGNRLHRQRVNPEEFEAAVRATAEDIGEELKFLDRWHERALGGGVLRTQIANLIARIVLTLTDEALGGAKMDLWSAHAGGPRMIADLEYRTRPE